MRNKRQLVGAFVMAAMMSVALPLSADTGGPGGAKTSTCAFLQGILWKVGNPAVVGAVFEAVFSCDLDY
jgi:hypothetical protein